MSDDRLNADVEQYLQAAAMNVAPPSIISDPLVDGGTPIEQLLRVLGLAANEGDPADFADSIDGHAERDVRTTEAAGNFAGQDAQAATQMAQQIPQLASGIAGSLAGVLGGALASLAQIPQQVLQAGLGLAQQTGGDVALDAGAADDLAAGELDQSEPGASGDFGDLGDPTGSFGEASGFGGGAGSSIPATAPAAMLGPPAVPSAATSPSSAPSTPPVAVPATPVVAPSGAGMSGVPMVPPGAVAGGSGADRDAKSDTRRISAPPVRNGAPVQGRLTTPPGTPAITRKVEGKPVATRRLVVSADPDDPERS